MLDLPVESRITRQRLLEVAGEVFADRGFRDATVRDICQQAGANVAAVNYHFGDKQKLYAAAVEYAHSCARKYAVDEGLSRDSTPDERLRAFCRGMLMGLLEDGKPGWHGKLIAREIAEPSEVLQQIVEHGIRPRFMLLSSIVRSVIGQDAPEPLVRRCARSIVGQMLFYHFAKPILVRLFADERFDSTAVEPLIEHVTAFSMAGLRGIAKQRAGVKVNAKALRKRKAAKS